MKIVLDGYNAPVSAGSFMDLVNKKFYDGMDIQRADGFVVQFGDPEGPAEGYEVNGAAASHPLLLPPFPLLTLLLTAARGSSSQARCARCPWRSATRETRRSPTS